MNKTRYLLYGLGITILTLGVALTILSDLGTSPFDALLVGLSKTVGFTVGTWEIIIALILIFCNSILKRNRPEYLGLATALITGLSINLWLFLLEHVILPEIFISKLICFGIGLIVTGIGSAIYLLTNFAPIPVDQSMLIIRERLKVNYMISKTILYVLFLLLAFIFKGPIGIGTVLTVCLGGPILNICMPTMKSRVNKLLMKKSNHVENSHSI
ncbi:YitT family protein [Bacillus sp. OAE603]|uniref:YczE/YyaS/YitT family protein n=1 Tax=Gottfriedia sp. OAE603 TaxID=2663872 RepID=UPI00178B5383